MQPTEWWRQADQRVFHQAVLNWYDAHGRDLPWRRQHDPYAVWVSEIMLQQTTTATVSGRFEAFLARFPTVTKLAAAAEQDVLHAWQGLGYYRRARHLHQAAGVIVDQHAGRFPESVADIEALPGLGKYTARAVACFGWGQKQPILEANTLRLWTRLAGAEGDPRRQPLFDQLWELAEVVLPTRRFADFNQAVMDLGSQVCKPRQPDCGACPLRPHCVAAQTSRQADLPQLPRRPTKVNVRHVAVAVVTKGRVLLRQIPSGGRWGGMWELPRVECQPEESSTTAGQRALHGIVRRSVSLNESFGFVKHGIMHFQVELTGLLAWTNNPIKLPADARWVKFGDWDELPLPSPQRRLLFLLQQHLDRQ